MKELLQLDIVVDPKDIILGELYEIPPILWIALIAAIVVLLILLTRKLTRKK